MKYREFIENIEFGNTTAFVYDSPNNRYTYSSGEICDDVFDNVDSDTEFTIVGINELPEVKEVIIDNFLSEIAPRVGVEDNGYDMVKKQLTNGRAKVGYWDEETHYGTNSFITCTYMLILIDQDEEEINVLVEYAFNACNSDRVAEIYCKESSNELLDILGEFNRDWEDVKIGVDSPPTKAQDAKLDAILEEYQEKINNL